MKEEKNSQFSILNSPLIPPGYKQTEVGVIPEDWEVLPVSKLGETKRGAGSLCIKYKSSGGVRLIRINDFFQDNPVFVEPTDEIMRYSINERDLLFAGTGASAGASYLPKKEWIGLPHSYNAPRIRVFENRCKEYLLYSLQSDYVLKQQRAWFVGNAQPFLDTKAISNFSISFPPTKAEQEAIAGALSDADALIESLEQLLTKRRYLKQGAMQELLTGNKRLPGFEVNPGYKQTEVGVIPEDWQPTTIGDLAVKVGSGITPKGGSSKYKEYGRPFVRSQNVGWGTLLLSDLAYIDDDMHNKFSATELKQDDVLLNITGASIGRSAIADARLTGGNVNQHVCIIRPDSVKVASRFINYFFLSDLGQRQIDSFQAGGNREGLNFGQIRSIKLPLPSTKTEQSAIAAILSDMDAEIAALEAKLAKARQLKQGMMQELLTGRIRLV